MRSARRLAATALTVFLCCPAALWPQSISTCVLRDSLGNQAPDTVPGWQTLGFRRLRTFWGTPLAEVASGATVPVYGDTVVASCRTTVMTVEQHHPGFQFPGVFLVDSQPPLTVLSYDSLLVNTGRRVASHPPLLDSVTGLPVGGFVEDTLDVFHSNLALYRYAEPAESLAGRVVTFYDSDSLPRSELRVPWSDSTRGAAIVALGQTLPGYLQHGTRPGLWEHRYQLDSVTTGSVVSVTRHETVDAAPPQIRSLWIDTTRQIGLQWRVHWLERGNRSSPDTILVFENRLNRTHLENRQVFPWGVQVIAAGLDNQAVRRAVQRITDWQETVFFGDSFAFDFRRLIVDEGIGAFTFGFIFNPRTPYLPYVDTGLTRAGDRTGESQFYLGNDRSYSRVRSLGAYHVSMMAEDARGQQDTVPITIVARGLRPTRLSFTTHDPAGRERRRCYGRGCTGTGSGGLEGRLFNTSRYDVVWDSSGWNLTAEATGHDTDLVTLENTRWSIGLQGKVTARDTTGRVVSIRGVPGDTWPASNNAWGLNNLRAAVRLDTFELGEALLLRVFFPRDARVLHDTETTRTPNWFKYWMQAIRATPGISPLSGFSLRFQETGPTGRTFTNQTTGAPDSIVLYSGNELKGDFRPFPPTGDGSRLFEHTWGCSNRTLADSGWAYPSSAAADTALLVRIGGLQRWAEVTNARGYCRIPGVQNVLQGIKALATVWEHEVGHVMYLQQARAWAASQGCAANGTCDAFIGVTDGTVTNPRTEVFGAVEYWLSSALGRTFGCDNTVQVAGKAVLRYSCYQNVVRWNEFVASLRSLGLQDAALDALRTKDWAYPGGQYSAN